MFFSSIQHDTNVVYSTKCPLGLCMRLLTHTVCFLLIFSVLTLSLDVVFGSNTLCMVYLKKKKNTGEVNF